MHKHTTSYKIIDKALRIHVCSVGGGLARANQVFKLGGGSVPPLSTQSDSVNRSGAPAAITHRLLHTKID